MQYHRTCLLVLALLALGQSARSEVNDTSDWDFDNDIDVAGTGTSPRSLELAQLMPSLHEFLTIKKNIIAAYPFEVAATVVDLLCSSTLIFHKVPPKITPDIRNMHFQLLTACQNFSVPIVEAERLWNLPAFDRAKKVVMLATGWTNTVNDSSTLETLSRAFLCRQDVNFIIVDTASYVDTLYKWAALNTEDIGEYIAVGLAHLLKVVPLSNIHLIGHSLGAHIMGSAGRTFTKLKGKLIPRITGLDPAKPCFRRDDALASLRRSDADFVDIIHTNIGILAKRDPLGDADFYPGGADALQPGCLSIACAHSRAVEYFAESVYRGNEFTFPGRHCASWTELKRQTCSASAQAWMGYAASRVASGIYYVEVNWKPPFGTSAKEGGAGATDTCHLCAKT